MGTVPTVGGVTYGELFAGYGGMFLGLSRVLPGRVAWWADTAPGPAAIMAHHHPDAPNLGDVTAVDWSTVPPVDVLTGGTPCQDLSTSGVGAGMNPGTRSGLWASMAHAIDALRPPLVVWENVGGVLYADATSALEPCPGCMGDGPTVPPMRALGRVVGDLATLGYDAWWTGLRVADVGGPHRRFRVFLFAQPATDPGRVRRQIPVGGQHPTVQIVGSYGDTGRTGELTTWEDYAHAVARWEAVLGRPAPPRTEPAHRGPRRLSPRFVEWMMGLPDGYVTGVPGIGGYRALAILGNGVVPQQIAAAARQWAADLVAT